jgi:poly(U)-specific endoribonuclease
LGQTNSNNHFYEGGSEMNIYQTIWDEDMNANGIVPISTSDSKNKTKGYVVVDTSGHHPDHHVIKEVYIPEKKQDSYKLVKKLFDNYNLSQFIRENNNHNEQDEVNQFLMHAINAPPMKLAKQFIEERYNEKYSETKWFHYLYDLWFRQFNWKDGRDLSGFEHVFIGEQNRKNLVGHHFWYKYWLEDHKEKNELHSDQVQLSQQNTLFRNIHPDVITLTYYLDAYDYRKRRFIKLVKKKCAYFVGISAEGLLALGTVRASGIVPHKMILNQAHYHLELYMSPDGKSIRTFYPKPVVEN